MLSKKFENVVFSGISCAVPSSKKSASEYVDVFGEKTVARFVEATGIEQRHVASIDQTASDLCFVAANELLQKKNIDKDEIDACIFITQFPDYKIPSTSYVLQYRLGLKKDCLVFDVNLGCAAFVNGIYFLAGLIESGTVKKALLLIGDVDHEYHNAEDISFSMMFGDAGAACLLERGNGTIRGMIRSDGEGFRTILTPMPGARFPKGTNGKPLLKSMNGEDTFLFTITQVPKLIKEYIKEFQIDESEIDYYVLHQANKMILQKIAKKLKVEEEKVPLSLMEYGNTDGASIPLTIAKTLIDRKSNKQKFNLITSGFGVGLSWGVVGFEIDSKNILPILETDEFWLEGRNVF